MRTASRRSAALAAVLWLGGAAGAAAQTVAPEPVVAAARAVQPKVVAWRRDLHQHPELANRETRTAKVVADHLRKLGLEVRTGVGKTGVIGVLKGGRPGKVVALRADMDALPVEEKLDLPFASKAKGEWEGNTVPLMHACGHDTHVAMLMGAAEVLAGMKAQIPGTVLFVFQPAEEGPPIGEEGGAALMLKEGAFTNPKPDAVFGLHVWGAGDTGTLKYRPKGFMASADKIEIKLKGRQTHGSSPWAGIDVVALGADVVQAINTIAARQINVTSSPSVATIATVHTGVRHNIIPEDMIMTGTLRTFDPERRKDMQERITRTVTKLAEAYGATASVQFLQPYPVTYNDPALSQEILPWLQAAAGEANVDPNADLVTGAEDFSVFQQQVPGVFYHLGVSPKDKPLKERASNHSPYFYVDEPAMEVGVRAHVLTALNYLSARAGP